MSDIKRRLEAIEKRLDNIQESAFSNEVGVGDSGSSSSTKIPELDAPTHKDGELEKSEIQHPDNIRETPSSNVGVADEVVSSGFKFPEPSTKGDVQKRRGRPKKVEND